MSFFRSLFSKSKKVPTDESGIQEHLAYLNSLTVASIAMSASAEKVLSRLGGLPSLPENVPWPEWKGKPLAFLCQLALNEIPDEYDRHGLPRAGMLYFFYDQKQETWGFDPNDRGSWRVIYAAAPSENAVPRAAPRGLQNDCVYHEKRVAFAPFHSYPDWQDERVSALDMSDKQSEEYMNLCSSVFGDNPAHQLFGFPSPVQGNDMDLECQLASHGLYCGDSSGFEDPRAKALDAGRHDWILLLQLDTDNDTRMMWGDCGMLYFWIRKQDLDNRSFEKCWMILQCS